jgi:flagellar hook-associated protein 2
MAAIEMTGLASGMDTKSIVKQLMEIERRPIYLKQDQIQKAQTEKKQWEEIGKQVKSFKTTAMDMNTNNPFRKFKSFSFPPATNLNVLFPFL